MCRQLLLHHLYCSVRPLTLALVHSWWFQNERIPLQNGDRLEAFKNQTEESFFSYKLTCFSSLFSATAQTQRYFVCSSVSLSRFPWLHCALWSAFGLPGKLLHSLTLYLTISHSFSQSASLCLLYLCLLLSKTQFQKAFSLNAGAAKEVNSPAAHRGIWYGAGATKSWFHSTTLQKSFAGIKECLNAKTLAIQMIGESLTDHSRTRLGETKKIVISGRVRRVYPCMLVHWICIYFSVFLCNRTLTVVVVDSSFKIEEFLHKMVISLKNCPVE